MSKTGWRAALLLALAAGSTACDEGLSPVPFEETNPPPVTEDVIQYLQDEAIPLATTDPTAPFEDLEPLRQLVGDARVVALGEATHGTREFFLMKHRLLRFLVEEMEFSVFALEAPMPEARRIDAYVKGGSGDPRELLSGLYFWTVNTSEILGLIEWTRVHNQSAPAPVTFAGFDLQHPGMAVDNVERFLRTHAPDSATVVIRELDCVRDYLNGPDGVAPRTRWVLVPALERDDCRALIQEKVIGFLERHRTSLVDSSSPEDFALVEQDARLVLQWEAYESVRLQSGRDRFMADNALWLLERAGPEAKMVLWAHNVHVSYMTDWQGDYMRQELGDGFVSVALSFGQGSFNAVTREISGAFTETRRQEVGPPPSGSYEYRFAAAGLPAFALDLREADAATGRGAWLTATLWFRSVGAIYQPHNPIVYFLREEPLSDLFDAVVYIDRTTESTLLPFRYPDAF